METQAAASPSFFASLRRRWSWLRRRWWGRWGVDLFLFGLVFAGIQMVQSWGLVGAGEPAPGFVLPDLTGQQVDLAQFKGKKTVLSFWAPWCSVCHLESANLSEIQEDMGDDVQVVSVVLSYDGMESIHKFIQDHGVDYPVLLGDRNVADDYEINKYPTVYILDEEGRVEHAMVGYTSTFGLRWRLWL